MSTITYWLITHQYKQLQQNHDSFISLRWPISEKNLNLQTASIRINCKTTFIRRQHLSFDSFDNLQNHQKCFSKYRLTWGKQELPKQWVEFLQRVNLYFDKLSFCQTFVKLALIIIFWCWVLAENARCSCFYSWDKELVVTV